jgi:hypothetical protein
MMKLLILLLLSSCSLFQTLKISQDIPQEAKKVCLNADGNGRLMVQGHKYVFSFETMLDDEEDKWLMSLNFPLHGEELIELNLSDSNAEFKQKIEDKILKERKGVNPELLHKFMFYWARFLNELIHLQKHENAMENSEYTWDVSDNKLKAGLNFDGNKIDAQFYNVENKMFSRMDFALQPAAELQDTLQIELIVRKCLDKTE